MRRWLEKMYNRLMLWMQGRYGQDQLSLAMSFLALLLLVLSMALGSRWLMLAVLVLSVIATLRCYSKNIVRRRAENAAYLRITEPLRRRARLEGMKWKDRKTHRYFRCPRCGQSLRVPKKKGKIIITCSRCGGQFQKKT